MKNFRNFADTLFENAESGGIREHQRGDVFGGVFAQVVGVELAAGVRFDVLHFVAGDHHRSRIRAVRRIGDENFFARIALRFEISANHQQAGEFALRASDGLESRRVHAGDFEQAFLQIVKDAQAALRKFDRLIGMLGAEAVEARYEFVYARIVFHGAGAERIHAQINRVIPGGEAREVANDFDFADFGEAFDFAARESAEFFGGVNRGDIERRQFDAAFARRGFFEDQPFVLRDVAARFCDFGVFVVRH